MDEDKEREIREIAKEVAAVITEDLQSQFKVFGEDLTSVKEKVNLLADDMDHVKSDIVDIKMEIKYMKGDIKDIKGELIEIKGKLDNKAEKETVENHEKRLVSLEKTTLPRIA